MSDLELPLAEAPIHEFLSLPSAENPDWGYARNRRSVLMVPSAEWIQSVYSCTVELNGKTWVVPNRDFPYEGLLVYQDGENWKTIDCVALALRHRDGGYIPFTADPVRPAVKLSPWSITYCYKIQASNISADLQGEIPFYVSYYLHSEADPEFVTGCVELYFPNGLVHGGVELTPVVQPFIDLRHMYANSDFDNYRLYADEDGGYRKRIHISSHNRTLTFYLPEVETIVFDAPEMLSWRYKLGTGSREEAYNDSRQRMETVFKGEEKQVAAVFNFEVPPYYGRKFVRLFFGCGLDCTPARFSLSELERTFARSRRKDREQYRQMEHLFALPERLPFRDAILARLIGLTKFKTCIRVGASGDHIRVPHAGAWWFKTPWYRDVFEGILNNFDALMRIPEERANIKDIILLVLREQDRVSGRILNRIPEFKDQERLYYTADATLLCFVVADAYVAETWDLDFALRVLPHAATMIAACQGANPTDGLSRWVDGPPRVDGATGLLLSVPWHSWMDTRGQSTEQEGRRYEGLPNRFSPGFTRELYARVADKEGFGALLSSPNFFLPEINALWITMLRGMMKTIAFVREQAAHRTDINLGSIAHLKEAVSDLLRRAEASFKRMFWNESNGYLFNAVYLDGKCRDDIECEAGVTAAALLGEPIFSRQELASMWQCARQRLLVERRLVMYGDATLPFGILAKNDGPSVFYGDPQYHGDVIWLRSTPYLIKLLRLLGENEVVEQILVNTLDHQMAEAAVFYNQELLARPLGNNPYPEERTCQNPIPVKNPVQFWSQWCDAFVEHFEKRRD